MIRLATTIPAAPAGDSRETRDVKLADRALIATTILAVDLVAFAVPLTALAAAWVVLARPAWFRRLVDALYGPPR
jgi:hypothetical protein